MNKVILIGRLTKEPEVRYTQGKEPIAVCKFTLAVNRIIKKNNEQEADFINCTTFGKQAETVEKYVKKGYQIAVTGRLQVTNYEDKDKQKRWATDVIVEQIDLLQNKTRQEQEDDDLPF
jgi:single-strand DNA-binding protein